MAVEDSPLNIYEKRVYAEFRQRRPERSPERHPRRREPSPPTYRARRSHTPPHYRNAPSSERFQKRKSGEQGVEDNEPCHTLFVGNLDPAINETDLNRFFKQYGIVQEVDIKSTTKTTPYAFVRFLHMDMATHAREGLNGTRVGGSQLRIGYGKSRVTPRLWIGGLGSWASDTLLLKEFDRFGAIHKLEYVNSDRWGFITYESQEAATAAWTEMKDFELVSDKPIRIDYAELDDPFLPSYKAPIEDSVKPGEDDKDLARMRYERDKLRHGSPLASPRLERSLSREKVEKRSRSGRRRSSSKERGGENSSKRYRVSDDEARYRDRSRERDRDDSGLRRKEMKRNGSVDGVRSNGSSGEKVKNDVAGGGAPHNESSLKSFKDYRKSGEEVWKGSLALKGYAFNIVTISLNGNVEWLRSVFSKESNVLKITQRLRLEERKLDDVKQRISTKRSGLILAFSGESTKASGSEVQELETYLYQKEAAGVAYTEDALIYVFPTCEFANSLIRKVNPSLRLEKTSGKLENDDSAMVNGKDVKDEKALLMVILERDHFDRE